MENNKIDKSTSSKLQKLHTRRNKEKLTDSQKAFIFENASKLMGVKLYASKDNSIQSFNFWLKAINDRLILRGDVMGNDSLVKVIKPVKK